jgi:hypothetical protein
MNTITLTQGANTITVKAPEYGYESAIAMNLHYSRVHGGYKIGDDGSVYDSRYCIIPSWLMDSTDMLEMSNFFNDMSKGRGQNFTLGLGATSGFYPFGCDFGESGNFICSLWDHKKEGSSFSPYRYFKNAITFYWVSGGADPDYDVETEGSLQVGTVTTLRHPQTLPKPGHEQAIVRAVSRSGLVSSVDLGGTGDVYESELPLIMKRGNCAALITYLTGSGRGSDIQVKTPANSWMFGIDNYQCAGTFTTKLLTPEIKIRHDSVNRFSTTLNFWMKSNDTPT